MPSAAAVMLLSLVALAQDTVSRPIVVGEPLVDSDISQIRVLSVEAGVGDPWLISSAASSPTTDERTVLAFGTATRSTSELRRGTMVRLTAGPSESTARPPRTWGRQTRSVEPIAEWAQVAAEGLAFDDIPDLWRANRPIRIIGGISDADLVSLVAFVRARPLTGPDGQPIFIGRRVLNSVQLRYSAATVVRYEAALTEPGGSASTHLDIERIGGSWRIVQVTYGIA